jgi:hypothetical protein
LQRGTGGVRELVGIDARPPREADEPSLTREIGRRLLDQTLLETIPGERDDTRQQQADENE